MNLIDSPSNVPPEFQDTLETCIEQAIEEYKFYGDKCPYGKDWLLDELTYSAMIARLIHAGYMVRYNGFDLDTILKPNMMQSAAFAAIRAMIVAGVE